MTSKEILKKVFERLWYIYKDHEGVGTVWEIGWSGGKDSTILLDIILRFFEKLKKEGENIPKTYIVHIDTLLEYPAFQETIEYYASAIKSYIRKKFNKSVKFVWLEPEYDFFWKIIIDGYPIPHFRFRWCVRWLKEKPLRNFEKTIINSDSQIVEITGLRYDESAERERIMMVRSGGLRSMYQGKAKNRIFYAPLFDISIESIFEYLSNEKPVWGGSYEKLRSVYKRRKQRYGCILCTVIKKDKMLDPHKEYDKKILELRNMLREISFNKNNRIIKNGRPSKLTKDARRRILRIVSENINLFNPAEQKRIRMIQKLFE